jgi:hypothetical protein
MYVFMTKTIRSSITLFIILTSCSSVPKTIYKDAGIYFKVTEDFRIGRADTYKKNQSTYIPLYIRDNDLYAKFSIIWLPGNWNLDKEIRNFTNGLDSAYIKEDPINKPEYGEIKDAKFGANIARQIDYVVPNDGPRIGSYTTFHCKNLTVIIGQHSTIENKAIIDRCRKVIEESYYCIASDTLKTDRK